MTQALAYLRDRDHQIVFTTNQLLDGHSNNVGTVTLTASVATTVVDDRRTGVNSVILFMPTTANAAAEVGAGTMYISARGKQTFTITHANNAQTDRTFAYAAFGAGE